MSAITVTTKHVPVEMILRDQAVTEIYIQDETVRRTSHGLLRGVWNQFEHIVGKRIKDSKIPDALLLDPIASPDVRLCLYEGRPHLENTETGALEEVFPPGFDISQILLVGNTSEYVWTPNTRHFRCRSQFRFAWLLALLESCNGQLQPSPSVHCN